jgi:hypothetical protein
MPKRKKEKKKQAETCNPAAVELGRLGGKARAAKLSKKELSEQGRKAAETRWSREKKRPPNW